MIARAGIALFALATLAIRAHAQSDSIWVEVEPTTEPDDPEETEKRYTPELVEELESAKGDALLLYTEFSARASQSLKQFIRNVSRLEYQTRVNLEPGLLDNAPEECRTSFENRLKKVQYDAYRAATFSGENHHKFFLGHMIVFRMHLNKSEEYVKKCDKVISLCGIKCETQPRIKRWRRLAADELNRLRDDLQHSRKMYRDLLTHAQRRLNTLRRRAFSNAKEATEILRLCVKNGGIVDDRDRRLIG